MPDYKKRIRFTELSLETQLVLWKHHFRSLWIPIWFAQDAKSKRKFEELLEPIKSQVSSDDPASKEFWIIAAEVWQAFKANQASFIESLHEKPLTLAFAMHSFMQDGFFNTQGDGEIGFSVYEQILKNFGKDLSYERRIKDIDNFEVQTPRLKFRIYAGEISTRKIADGYLIKLIVDLVPFPDERFSLRSAFAFLRFLEEVKMPIEFDTFELEVSGRFVMYSSDTDNYTYPVFRLAVVAIQLFEPGNRTAVDMKYSSRGWILSTVQSALGVEVVEV